MTETSHKKTAVQYIAATEDDSGQRIDNFLMRHLKNIPKSRLYRLLRKGEVRVNSKRVSACYKLNPDDRIRLPPVYLEAVAPSAVPGNTLLVMLKKCTIYEDKNLLIINKPAGLSVHGGSSVKIGLIEALHHLYPEWPALELAHRLDAETSGCLILAKKRSILKELHELFRLGQIKKIYWVLTKGKWRKNDLRVTQPLYKHYGSAGKHKVVVSSEGKPSCTIFRSLADYSDCSLMEAELLTGRTHQIRVHAAHLGHPVLGDDRYGDPHANLTMKKMGLNRLFLHAKEIDFVLPSTKQHIQVNAPLDSELLLMIEKLNPDTSSYAI
ncbi:MAG: hypothetical protein A3F43_02320 [Gammaproteobacteria bacterium RIFCSPHIGHO2_12_FULL_42_10]|nr:MAG: hypothetical protein A3F43_02320 [Gammaproteobacteria bacterium RIFCSPHIGHO2_12_FULL_42_10]